MKLNFKFWLWRINLKTSRLDKDEKIGYLANQLAKEIMASGRDIAHPDISDGFGSFDIDIHRLGKKDACLDISSATHEWKLTTKPAFKKF